MKKILIVNGSPCEMSMVVDHLSNDNYEIMKAGNGKEAIEVIKINQPDVVITDWIMPLMGGLELCRKLRKNLQTEKIPVILSTSSNREVDRFWAKKQGVTGYLIKPWTKSELSSTLEQVLALKYNQKLRDIAQTVSQRKVITVREKMAISVSGTI